MADALPPELSRVFDAAGPTARDAAWEAFIMAQSRLLLHVARSVCVDHDGAMDAYAYVLEQLREGDFRRLRAYAADQRSKFSTWLVVVARRLCLDWYRQRYGRARAGANNTGGAREERSARRRLVDLAAEQMDLAALRDPSGRTPESDVRVAELRQALESALAELEPRDRLLLTLRFEDELTAQEISAVMHFSTPFHVYRRLTHLLDSLRDQLTRRGVEDPVP